MRHFVGVSPVPRICAVELQGALSLPTVPTTRSVLVVALCAKPCGSFGTMFSARGGEGARHPASTSAPANKEIAARRGRTSALTAVIKFKLRAFDLAVNLGRNLVRYSSKQTVISCAPARRIGEENAAKGALTLHGGQYRADGFIGAFV